MCRPSHFLPRDEVVHLLGTIFSKLVHMHSEYLPNNMWDWLKVIHVFITLVLSEATNMSSYEVLIRLKCFQCRVILSTTSETLILYHFQIFLLVFEKLKLASSAFFFLIWGVVLETSVFEHTVFSQGHWKLTKTPWTAVVAIVTEVDQWNFYLHLWYLQHFCIWLFVF